MTNLKRMRARRRAGARARIGLSHAAAAFAVSLAVLLPPAHDAFGQAVPPSVDPGRIPGQLQPPRTPGVDPRTAPVDIPQTVPPDRARQIRFVLQSVTVVGATVYTPDQLSPLYRAMVGKQVTLLDVYNLANAITAKYRRDGYILSRAVVPTQQIRGGNVQILIVEGRINEIIIRDQGKLFSHHLLLRQGDNIKDVKPLTQAALERYLLLMNDMPGVRVSSVLAPSPVPGTANLILEVTHKPFDAGITLDNRGSRFLGPYQLDVGGSINGIIDIGDRLGYRAVFTPFQSRELQYHEVRYLFTLNDEGTTIEWIGGYTNTRPGYTLKTLDVRGESYASTVRLRHPVIRSRQENLWLYLMFDWRNSQNSILGALVSDDRLRVFRAGATYEFIDPIRGANAIDFQISHGANILGARGDSRAFGRTDFTKVNIEYQRNQQIWRAFSAFLALSAQYAGTQLLASEEFGLGGRNFARAFDSSEKTGDHGIAALAELRYTFDPIKIPEVDAPATLQLFGFIDWGRVYHIDATRPTFETLSSIGAGVRFNLGTHLSGQVEVGYPLHGRVAALGTSGREPRVFFVLTARY